MSWNDFTISEWEGFTSIDWYGSFIPVDFTYFGEGSIRLGNCGGVIYSPNYIPIYPPRTQVYILSDANRGILRYVTIKRVIFHRDLLIFTYVDMTNEVWLGEELCLYAEAQTAVNIYTENHPVITPSVVTPPVISIDPIYPPRSVAYVAAEARRGIIYQITVKRVIFHHEIFGYTYIDMWNGVWLGYELCDLNTCQSLIAIYQQQVATLANQEAMACQALASYQDCLSN